MSKIKEMLNKYKLYLDENNYNEINYVRSFIFEFKINNKLSNQEEKEFEEYEDLFFKNYFYSFPESYKEYIKNKPSNIDSSNLDELLVLRNNYSNKLGYSNYYDYMFIEDNRYFYNHENILNIRKFVLKYLVPLNENINYIEFDYNDKYLKDIKNYINSNYLGNVLVNEINSNDSWHLLYYPYSNKFDIYCKYKNNEKDIYNLAHEYGHIFQLIDNSLFDLVLADYSLSEIFSSYSEILCIKSINDKILINNHIKKMLETIISSVATDEFLEYLYKNINDSNKDGVFDSINKKYNISTSKKWYNDTKRIKYPYRAIDYAIAYISTLYAYNKANIDNYKKIKEDYYEYTHMDIVKNNNLGNPFDVETYKRICNEVRGIINEN